MINEKSTSKSQQRLFGWALACKRGTSKSCPMSVKKLADSMSEDELEKFAKTSHKDLPERVKESLDNIFAIYAELVEAESGESIDTYVFEMDAEELTEAKHSGSSLDPKIVAKAGGYKTLKSDAPKGSAAKTPAKEAGDEIPQPEGGKEVKAAKEETPTEKQGGVDTKATPAVDNDTKVVTDKLPEIYPGMNPAGKTPFDNVYTPDIHKFPMGKAKNERRVYDFNQFLKIINYKTHDDILQAGHGQNLTGGKQG